MNNLKIVIIDTARPSVYNWPVDNCNENVDEDLRALIDAYQQAIKRFLKTKEVAANEEQLVTREALEDMLSVLFKNTSEDESYKIFSRVYERDDEDFKVDVMKLRCGFTNYAQSDAKPYAYPWIATYFATKKFFGKY